MMVMQSVLAQTSGIRSKTAGHGSGVKRTGERGFELLLNQGVKSEAKIPERARANTGNGTDTKNGLSTEKKASAGKKLFPEGAGTEKTVTESGNDKSIKPDAKDIISIINMQNDDEEPAEQIDMDLAGQFQAMLNQIRDAMMEVLNLTPEEFNNMMEELELKLTDLTDPHAIMELVLADGGAKDSTALITNENLEGTFKDVLRIVEDIKKDAFELTKEELQSLMEQISSNEEASDTDEAELLKPMDNQKRPVHVPNETEHGEDKSKFQTVSEEDSIQTKAPAVTTKGGDLSDMKGNKDEFVSAERFEAFLDRLSTSYAAPDVELRGDALRAYELREIAGQIIEQIRVNANPGQASMELQLHPEHLGRVDLTVTAKDGVMTAKFAVQNEMVKEAVEVQMIALKETLEQQGIKVEAIEVTVAGHTFEQKNPSDEANQTQEKKNKSGHKISFEEAVAMNEESGNEADAARPLDGRGHTIDYTA